MIKLNELRVGNWVMYSACQSTAGLKGIPITEEILFKCGFNQIDRVSGAYSDWEIGERYRFNFRLESYDPPANNFGVQDLSKKSRAIYYFNWNTKYVHQLQNLYFALTGKELEVSL